MNLSLKLRLAASERGLLRSLFVRPGLLAILAAGLVLGGCGKREIEPPLAGVHLTIDGPADGGSVDADTVTVSGSVTPPGATVLVNGDQVGVSHGSWSTTVSLQAGTNVIDVQAGAPKHPSAMTALRVTRLVKVTVPTLDGLSPKEAQDQLSSLGLKADLQDLGDSILDEIIGGEPRVCGTDPAAGTEVSPGATIKVGYAKSC